MYFCFVEDMRGVALIMSFDRFLKEKVDKVESIIRIVAALFFFYLVSQSVGHLADSMINHS